MFVRFLGVLTFLFSIGAMHGYPASDPGAASRRTVSLVGVVGLSESSENLVAIPTEVKVRNYMIFITNSNISGAFTR